MTGRVSREQLEWLDRISKEEKIDRSSALRRIIEIGIDEYRKRRAIDDYRRGRISIGKAAENGRLSLAEFYEALEAEGIPVRVDLRHLKESIRSDFGK